MARSQDPTVQERAGDALTVADLRRLLPAGIGRTGAYQIAREIGVRVGRRRLLISRARFDRWLAGERGAGA
jgi:hypothetical protein